MFEGLKRIFGLNGKKGLAMISCDEVRARLFEYLDEELDQVLANEVREHLDACPRCYPRAAFEKNFLDAVRRTEEGRVAGAELKNRILEALAAEGTEE